MNKSKPHRQANFELLRILAMLMVVTLHYLSHADALITIGEPLTGMRLTGSLVESFCIVAVDIWVLISGYFLSKSHINFKRFVELLLVVFFYTFGISVVMLILGISQVKSGDTIFKTVQYLFPISSEHYWFATSYVWMYLLSPVLNKGVKYMNRKQMRSVIMGLLFWFCIIKSFVPVNFPTDNYGYSLDWFICLYLIAAYIREYDVTILDSGKKSLCLYIISCGLIYILTIALYYVNLKTGRLEYFFSVMGHYNYILCLTGALGVFSAFRHLQLREGALSNMARFIAPTTFGVYLFHEHLEIRYRWLSGLENILGPVPEQPITLICHMILCVCIVFITGMLFDLVRIVIFKFVARNLEGSRLMDKINALNESLHQQNT